MDKQIRVDEKKCTGCGLCVTICCENHVFAPGAGGGAPEVRNEDGCSLCGHCVAVCPADAIVHGGLDMEGFKPVDRGLLPAPEAIENFLFSIRSVRHYRKEAVPGELLERLVAAGARAASDHNSQDREFIVVTDPKKMKEWADRTVSFYRRLLKLLKKPVLRALSLPMPGMMEYLEGSLPDMRRMVAEYDSGIDTLFHGAPCVIAITGRKSNSLARDTALTAQEHIRALAHSMGLGTCISGYAISAPGVADRALGVDRGRTVCTIFSLGYPKYKFRKTASRNPAVVKWL